MPFGIVWPGQSLPLTHSLPCNIHKGASNERSGSGERVPRQH